MASHAHKEVFNCSAEQLYNIIVDYEKYHEFIKEIKSCKVLKKEAKGGLSKKLVEYNASMIKTFKYQMWMTEKAPTAKETGEVKWEFVSGDIFKTSVGSWTIKPTGAKKCEATYAVEATFGLLVPSSITKTLLSVNLPAMMKGYHTRIEELYGA